MRRIPLTVAAICVLLTSAVMSGRAAAQLTIEPLDIAGEPPGLEGTAVFMLEIGQDGDEQRLVVAGGCMQSFDFFDQALVLSDLSEGFEDLSWHSVPVPDMGGVCEHSVSGPGEVAYLIGGYVGDYAIWRSMDEVLELRMRRVGKGSDDLVIETRTIDIPCTDCPPPRVGHAAEWVPSFPGCEGGGVFIAGGLNTSYEFLDDAWFFCPGDKRWSKLPGVLSRLPDIGALAADDPFEWDSLNDRGFLMTRNPDDPEHMQLLMYDLQTGQWSEVQLSCQPPGDRPLALFAANLILSGDGYLYLFNGYYAETGEPSDAIWRFNVDHRDGPQCELAAGNPGPAGNSVVMLLSPLVLPKSAPARHGDAKQQAGISQAFTFGGVTSSFPRVVSNTAHLLTFPTPGALNDYAVPAVARVRGAGAFFTSLIHLFNAGASSLQLDMVFTPRQGSGDEAVTVTHTVPAGVLQTIEDPLESLFGFTGDAGRVGSVLIKINSGRAADLMAQTVVFARLSSGEQYGQFFPALRVADAIVATEIAYLTTTEDPVRNRVNVGLTAVADGTRFEVTPVDPIGTALATTMAVDLGLGGNAQINDIHTAFALGTRANVVVEVEVVSGAGFTYASVLDGNLAYAGTSDPTTILPSEAGWAQVTLLEIGSIQGVDEFSGSASVTNFSDFTATVQADFRLRGSGDLSASQMLTIPPGTTVGYTDLAADLFGILGDVGTVVLTATNAAEIGATGREFAILRDAAGQVVGTAGQLIAGQTERHRVLADRTFHFIGLRQAGGGGAIERSHLAVFNPNETAADITVRLYDGASGAFEGERTWTIPPTTLLQFNNLIRQINNGHDGEEKRIEVEVSQRVLMNVFRINIWGDPVTLSPFAGGLGEPWPAS